MQVIMNILAGIVKIMADIGITKVVHTLFTDILKPHNVKKTTKACVYVGEFMVCAVIAEKNDKFVDDTLDKVAKFMVEHDLDKKLGMNKKKENEDAGKQHSDELRIV